MADRFEVGKATPWDILQAVFNRTDSAVSTAIAEDRLHRGTALFVLRQFALEAEEICRSQIAGGELIATHTEAAVRSNETAGPAIMERMEASP